MKYFKIAANVVYMSSVALFYSPHTAANSAAAALNANRLDEARALFLQQLQNPNTSSFALTHLGEVEIHSENYDQAVDYLQRAVAATPSSSKNYFLLGTAYCQQAQKVALFSALGLAKKCIANLEKAHSLDPKNTQVLQALVAFHSDAPSIAGGSSEKLSHYSAALNSIAPDIMQIHTIKALEKDKKHAEAIKLALVLKHKENFPISIHYSLARYFKSKNTYSEAEELLERLIKTPVTEQTSFDERREIEDAHLQLAEVLLARQQQLDRAALLIKEFQQKNNNPNDKHYLWSFWSLAKIYKAGGQTDKYTATVNHIKTLNYKKNKHFTKEFEEALKNPGAAPPNTSNI